jgi:cytochrome c-type biogenesis protein CcmH/NrfG
VASGDRSGRAARPAGDGRRCGAPPAREADLAAIQREIDADCGNPEPYIRAARLLVACGRASEAAAYLEDALELAPDAPGIRDLYRRWAGA